MENDVELLGDGFVERAGATTSLFGAASLILLAVPVTSALSYGAHSEVAPPPPIVVEEHGQPQKVLNISEQIAYVQNKLGLTVTDLAEVLECERRTIYLWKKGGALRDKVLQSRLKALLELSSHVKTKVFGAVKPHDFIPSMGMTIKDALRGTLSGNTDLQFSLMKCFEDLYGESHKLKDFGEINEGHYPGDRPW